MNYVQRLKDTLREHEDAIDRAIDDLDSVAKFATEQVGHHHRDTTIIAFNRIASDVRKVRDNLRGQIASKPKDL